MAIDIVYPEMERRTVAARLEGGRRRCFSEGFHWPGTPPYGYRYHGGGKKMGYWEVCTEEARVVRQVFEWAAAGISMVQISIRLNEGGVPTRRGGEWYATTISDMLARPLYKGWHYSRRTRTVAAVRAYKACSPEGQGRKRVRTSARRVDPRQWEGGQHVPELALVSEETWQRANDWRRINRRVSPRNERTPSLLHGLAVCGHPHPGSPERRMHHAIRRKGQREVRRFECTHRIGPGRTGPRCPGAIRAEVLEKAVWARVRPLVYDPADVLADVQTAMQQARDAYQQAIERAARLRAAQRKAQETLDRLVLGFYAGDVAEEQYRRLRALLGEEARAAQRELARTAPWAAQPCPELLILDDLEVGPDALARLDALPFEERQRKVRSLVEKVVVDAKGAYLVGTLEGLRERLHVGPTIPL